MLESGISDEYLIYLSGVGEEEESEEVFQDSKIPSKSLEDGRRKGFITTGDLI